LKTHQILKHPKSSNKTWAWTNNLIIQKYSQDIWDLSDVENKLVDFHIKYGGKDAVISSKTVGFTGFDANSQFMNGTAENRG
jgi:hypothetical protein